MLSKTSWLLFWSLWSEVLALILSLDFSINFLSDAATPFNSSFKWLPTCFSKERAIFVLFNILSPLSKSKATLKSSSKFAIPLSTYFASSSAMLFIIFPKLPANSILGGNPPSPVRAIPNPVPISKDRCSLWNTAVSQGSIFCLIFKRSYSPLVLYSELSISICSLLMNKRFDLLRSNLSAMFPPIILYFSQ